MSKRNYPINYLNPKSKKQSEDLSNLLAQLKTVDREQQEAKKDKLSHNSKQKEELIGIDNIIDPHEDCKNQIRISKQKQRLLQQQNQDTNREYSKLKKNAEDLKKQLEKKNCELALAKATYSNLMEKHHQNRAEFDHIKKYAQETSLKYRNAITAYKSKKLHDENSKCHEIQTMEKIIKFYDDFYNNGDGANKDDAEKQLRQFIQFSAKQQADIEALLLKLVEKEEYYNDKCKDLEEQRKIWQSEFQFNHDTCNNIELGIKKWIDSQFTVYNRCIQINEENERLRISLQEMKNQLQKSKTVQNNFKRYQEQLQRMIKEFNSKLDAAINADTILTNELRAQKERNDQLSQANIQQMKQINTQATEISELTIKYKQKEGYCIDLQDQLKNANQRNQQLSKQLEILTQKPTIKEELVLSASIQLNLEKSICSSNYEPMLATSEIANSMKQLKRQILQKIEILHGGKVARTRLIFRKDQFHHNFGSYLTGEFSLLLLIKINDRKLIGVYTSAFSETPKDNSQEIAFLFTCKDSTTLKIYEKENKTKGNHSRSVKYEDNALIFGDYQLIIRNNFKEKQFTLNTNIFGQKYFKSIQSSEKRAFLEDGENKIRYEELEIHSVERRVKFS